MCTRRICYSVLITVWDRVLVAYHHHRVTSVMERRQLADNYQMRERTKYQPWRGYYGNGF